MHYYSEKQISQPNIRKIRIFVKNIEFKLYSGSGVFSKSKLDKGSKLLIENCIIKPNWKVLDIGCGIGVIGIAIKKLYPTTMITMTDINERAVKISKMNIKLHKLEGIKVVKSNIYSEIKDKFITILVNPPQTAGRDVCFEIIEKAPQCLEKNGLLQLVARQKKGGIVLKEKMSEVFGNVSVLAKKSGYAIYLSELP